MKTIDDLLWRWDDERVNALEAKINCVEQRKTNELNERYEIK